MGKTTETIVISDILQMLVRLGASDVLMRDVSCMHHSVEQCNVVQEIPARWVYGATFEMNAICTMLDCMMQRLCTVQSRYSTFFAAFTRTMEIPPTTWQYYK